MVPCIAHCPVPSSRKRFECITAAIPFEAELGTLVLADARKATNNAAKA